METAGPLNSLGRYRLTSRIATGGMAEVFLARAVDALGAEGPAVAVKRLLPHLARDANVVRMFLNEARITAQIRHPNVVRVIELGQHGSEPFIAMELLEGRTWAELRQRAADGGRRMPLGVALCILTQACRGLDAAHKATSDDGRPLALVHRDFTPDNIHVGTSGQVKVIDFGIAKTASLSAGTEPGTLKGKYFYMSPELILAKPVDHRADVFAAGVMLYEQLCGRRPFTGTSVEEVVAKIASGKPTPPTQHDPSVSTALEALCLTALHRNPDARFPSLEAFADAIEALGGEATVASPAEVAAYVAALFPPAAPSGAQPAPAPRPSAPRARWENSLDALTGSPANTGAGAFPPRAPAPPPQPPPSALVPRRRRPRWRLGAAVGVVGLLVGAALALRHPEPAPEALLERAAVAAPAERVQLLVRAASAAEATVPQLERAAALLLEAQAPEAALRAVDAWLARAPQSVEARLLEARAATDARLGKRAEAAIAEASRLAPQDWRSDAALARLRERQGDAAGALAAWARAAEKPGSAPEALARQGYWLSQAGRLDEAEQALTRSLRGRADAVASAELGFVKYRKGRADEALRLLRGAVKDAPESMVARYYLGAVLAQRGDLRGARESYDAADALAKDDPRPLSARCELEVLSGDAATLDAVKARLRERFPKDAAALIARCGGARRE
jgi:tetratricopeptide (TPR) repeat protein